MTRKLGQYMTPPKLAALAARELGRCDVVIDFAAGEGALLRAVRNAYRDVEVFGVDLDPAMVKMANTVLDEDSVRRADGLKARVPKLEKGATLGVIGNPPYCPLSVDSSSWAKKAFPDLAGKHGADRAEVQFFARALVTARKYGGKVVMIMPIGFADGDFYRKVRVSLMQNYGLTKVIEVGSGIFSDTEARTVILVVDTARTKTGLVKIYDLDRVSKRPRMVRKGPLEAGARLDARYHQAIGATQAQDLLQLKDLEISVTRGLISNREAVDKNIRVVHTTDLARAMDGILPVRDDPVNGVGVMARPGDILLSRTGSRVSWRPVVVIGGAAPITDHVFRIRMPAALREVVYDSFRHPSFPEWLKGISKGVCAAVITKRELMEMPIFALADQAQALKWTS